MKIFLLSLLICFNSFCQDSTKLSRQYFTAGAISLTASILPFYVAHTTYINNKNNHYSYLFVGVWISFGVVLDINSIHCFKKSCELRKKNNF